MRRPETKAPISIVLFALLLSFASETLVGTSTTAALAGENPAAPGFLLDESDAEAIALADRVMTRLGGREAWDATRYVTWKFFGRRLHVWDRHSGDIRVEGADRETREPYLVLMNLHSGEGRAWQAGEEVTDAEELAKRLELGESAWINDSYWMFMPFKLKDTGVALKHIGSGQLLDGRPAEVVELTFREVGRTPENKYRVYVARDSGLVEQWDFYTNASDEAPRFQVPWRNWRRHGAILLSDDRGQGRHTDIAVLAAVPEGTFSSQEPVDLSSAPAAPTGNLPEAPIYAVEGDVMKPRISHSVAPEYPEAAKEAETTGLVVVRAVIGKNGSIRDAWVSQPLDPALDAAALAAVRQWTFDPATLRGEAVEVYYNLTVNFQLDGDGGGDSDDAGAENGEPG